MMITGTLAKKGLHTFDGELKTHTGLKTEKLWIVTADRAQAHVYRRTADGLERIARAEAKGKQMRSTGGHVFSPQSMVSHGHPGLRRENLRHFDEVFIRRLVEWLDVAEKEKVFDGLVLAAAPYTLGNIRACLTKNLEGRVRAELNKELTHASPLEIQKHIDKIM